jgi:hypothetical protein
MPFIQREAGSVTIKDLLLALAQPERRRSKSDCRRECSLNRSDWAAGEAFYLVGENFDGARPSVHIFSSAGVKTEVSDDVEFSQSEEIRLTVNS